MLNKLIFLKQKLSFRRLLLSCFLLVSFSFAAKAELKTSQITSTSQLAVQVFFGLLLVLALIFSLTWLARKMRFMPMNAYSKGALRTLASLQLGTKEKLVLVEVNEEQFLLGVTSQQINLIDKLDKPLALPKDNNKPVFAKFLHQWQENKQPSKNKKEQTNAAN